MSVILPKAPQTEDGRLIIQPVTLDRGLWHWYHSAGDVLGGARAGDASFQLQASSGDPDVYLEWQYNDWVEMAGGIGMFVDAAIGDWVEFSLYCPESVGTNTPGVGNANKVPIGPGINVFVPAAGDGDWTLDLTDRADAVPIPTETQNGYWDWSWPDAGVGEVTPNLTGNGYYQLYDFAINPLTRFLPRVNIIGNGEARFLPENVHPTDVLPHWKLRAGLHHGGGANTVKLVWHLVAARKNTI